MTTETIYLNAKNPKVTLKTYIAEESPEMPNNGRKAILVLPGGGYAGCSDREAEPIAKAYFGAGMNVFVLRYSVGKNAIFPQPLLDASCAIHHIRSNAKKYNIHPDQIYVIGFSAGGHLASALGTLWHERYLYDALEIPYGSNKPNGMILAYPVVSMGEFGDKGTSDTLFGTSTPTQEQLDLYSLEKHVDERTAPAFLWHTADDAVVPVENTLLMATALSAKKIPFEVHIFPKGPHGFALGTRETVSGNPEWLDAHVAKWVPLSIEWLESLAESEELFQ